MEEMPVAIAAPSNLLRMLRKFVATTCVLALIVLIFLFISETKNEITVANRTSSPVGFELEWVNQFRTVDNELPDYDPVFGVQTIPPHSSLARTFRLPERKSLVLADIRITRRGPVTRYRRLPKWGNRISVVVDGSRTSKCEVTALRHWFDKNRTWLEDYRKWIPLTNGWWQ